MIFNFFDKIKTAYWDERQKEVSNEIGNSHDYLFDTFNEIEKNQKNWLYAELRNIAGTPDQRKLYYQGLQDMLSSQIGPSVVKTPQIEPRRGDWIQTYTGKKFYPLDPRPEDIDIRDIAHALSNQCRFGGHIKQFYSVAEHAVRVSKLLPQPLKLRGLLHDASEAYLMDIPSPFKYLPEMSTYRTFESAAQFIIYLRFNIYGPDPVEVRKADKIMLAVEARDLLAPLLPGWENWLEGVEYPKDEKITYCRTPKEAEAYFLDIFADLT